MIAAFFGVVFCMGYLLYQKDKFAFKTWYVALGHSVVLTAISWVLPSFQATSIVLWNSIFLITLYIAACSVYLYTTSYRKSELFKIEYAVIDGSIVAFLVLVAGFASRGLIRVFWLDFPSWHYLKAAALVALVCGIFIVFSALILYMRKNKTKKEA